MIKLIDKNLRVAMKIFHKTAKISAVLLLIAQGVLAWAITMTFLSTAFIGDALSVMFLAAIIICASAVMGVIWLIAGGLLILKRKAISKDPSSFQHELWSVVIGVLLCIYTILFAPAYIRWERFKLSTVNKVHDARTAAYEEKLRICEDKRRVLWENIWSATLSRFPLPSVTPVPRQVTESPPYYGSRDFVTQNMDQSHLIDFIVSELHSRGIAIRRNVTYGLGTQIEASSKGTTLLYHIPNDAPGLVLSILEHPDISDRFTENYSCRKG